MSALCLSGSDGISVTAMPATTAVLNKNMTLSSVAGFPAVFSRMCRRLAGLVEYTLKAGGQISLEFYRAGEAAAGDEPGSGK
jgi:hypothetical protein